VTSFEIETDALFYRLLHSYLLQQPALKENYAMLLGHYHEHQESFKILKKHEILWLNQIQNDVKNNRLSLFSSPLDLSPTSEILKKEKSDQSHKDICREIIRNKEIIEPFTGPIKEMNIEHPVRFGFIDLIAYSNRRVYIIEIKSKSADHSIVGQMMKYYVGMCLKLVLKLFDEVKMITLCPGYDQSSFSGLKQMGAIPLIISKKPLRISGIE
jgi:hypothetical protein